MIDIVISVAVGFATFGAGMAAGRYLWPRGAKVGEFTVAMTTQEPPACTQRGHDPHLKGAMMKEGRKHAIVYCAHPGCGREWLRPL